MSNDERHRDLGEAMDSLIQSHAERGCLKSRLAKFTGQLQDVIDLLKSDRPAVCDGKLVRHGAATEGELIYPDRSDVVRAVEQYNVAIEKHESAKRRCNDLGLTHLLRGEDQTWNL